jgi:hypothetical protein|tara:strand:+ start:806 stop:1012 length:207 start_codon:yes stop_codon:yes gene_type:complete
MAEDKIDKVVRPTAVPARGKYTVPLMSPSKVTKEARKNRPQTAGTPKSPTETVSFKVYQQEIRKLLGS